VLPRFVVAAHRAKALASLAAATQRSFFVSPSPAHGPGTLAARSWDTGAGAGGWAGATAGATAGGAGVGPAAATIPVSLEPAGTAAGPAALAAVSSTRMVDPASAALGVKVWAVASAAVDGRQFWPRASQSSHWWA
jgi:hypothetical protein